KQHLELAREIATSFNHRYSVDHFPLPEPQILGEATRVMSLRDGTSKMSKSDQSDYSRINLTDTADDIALKVRKAKTDPEALPSEADGLEGRPEADNLVTIYAALAGSTKEAVLGEFGGGQFSALKQSLADLAVEKLGPITERMNSLLGDIAEIDRILDIGAEKANDLASPILAETRQIMGLR
ncbi:MAG: tryptophan--tRNA ligase, partial [Pseudomonadota bacterium]